MKNLDLSDGYVKVYRRLLDHSIFKDARTLQLFIYCLLRAGHRQNKVECSLKEITLERGQFMTSIARIARDTRLTHWQIRSRLNFLKCLGILTIKTTNRYSIITVCNYCAYQDSTREEPQTKPHAGHKQTTTNKNEKNEKNKYIECSTFERLTAFLSSLPEYLSFSVETRDLILDSFSTVHALIHRPVISKINELR